MNKATWNSIPFNFRDSNDMGISHNILSVIYNDIKVYGYDLSNVRILIEDGQIEWRLRE